MSLRLKFLLGTTGAMRVQCVSASDTSLLTNLDIHVILYCTFMRDISGSSNKTLGVRIFNYDPTPTLPTFTNADGYRIRGITHKRLIWQCLNNTSNPLTIEDNPYISTLFSYSHISSVTVGNNSYLCTSGVGVSEYLKDGHFDIDLDPSRPAVIFLSQGTTTININGYRISQEFVDRRSAENYARMLYHTCVSDSPNGTNGNVYDLRFSI